MAGTRPAPVPNQNLINPSKQVSFGRPPGYWKSITLDFLSVASALAFGYSYFLYLTAGYSLWFAFGAFLAFSVCSVLQVFLAPARVRRMLIVLLEAIALVICFLAYSGWQIALLAFAVALAVLLWGYFAARTDMENQLEIQFFRAARNVLGKVTTAALFVVLVVYVPQAKGNGAFVSRENFRTLFNWAVAPLGNFPFGVPLTGSFGSFSQDFARTQLEGDPTFAAMSPALQDAAIQRAAAAFSDTLTKVIGNAPSPTELTSDVAYDYFVSSLAATRGKSPEQFTIFWIVTLFIVLRALGIVAVWIAAFVSLVAYEILIAAGFMKISESVQTKETVTY